MPNDDMTGTPDTASPVETMPPTVAAPLDAMPDTAAPFQLTEEPTCATCDTLESDCDCVVCRSCQDRTIPGEICATCERCTDGSNPCCVCWFCNTCRENHTDDVSRCDSCEQCSDRCECWFCERCETHYNPRNYSPCERCERCSDCCECDSESDIPYQARRATPRHAKNASERKINRSRRLIGVEIEVAANKDDGDAQGLWEYCERHRVSVVEDGSLDTGGYELNTVPCAGDHYVTHITALTRLLADASAKVTDACGLHVHIDASDFRFYDMRRLVMLYAKLEPALFAMMPSKRRTSTFCEPCGDIYVNGLNGEHKSKEAKAMLISNVYRGTGSDYTGSAFKDIRDTKWGSARYRALNIHSWIYRGTVECRLHGGTVSARKIIAWGMLWASILDTAMRMTETEINALVCDTDYASAALLHYIAPTDNVREYIDYRLAKFSGFKVVS